MRVLALAYLALSALDLGATQGLVRDWPLQCAADYREANPFAARCLAVVGPNGLAAWKVGVVCLMVGVPIAVICRRGRPEVARRLLWFANIVTGAVGLVGAAAWIYFSWLKHSGG